MLKKTLAALEAGLTPIVCVGETLEQREGGQTEAVLVEQCRNGIAGLTAEQFAKIVIAYEPVWAIGTGKTATPEMAADAHRVIRGQVRARSAGERRDAVRILYGGSVKPDNVKGPDGAAGDRRRAGGRSQPGPDFFRLDREFLKRALRLPAKEWSRKQTRMFTWICPQCGREVPPSYTDCPDCAAKGKASTASPHRRLRQPPPPQAQRAEYPGRRSTSPRHRQPPQYQPPRHISSRRYRTDIISPLRPTGWLATWLMSIVFALAFGGLVLGAYYAVEYFKKDSSAAAHSGAAADNPPAASSSSSRRQRQSFAEADRSGRGAAYAEQG